MKRALPYLLPLETERFINSGSASHIVRQAGVTWARFDARLAGIDTDWTFEWK
jgi:hypothetical protein